jgi:hypothetical protein
VIVARVDDTTNLPEIGYMPKRIRRRASRERSLRVRSHAEQKSFEAEDPLLALRGLGKELWKELGGGEKFIHQLRSNWYGKGQEPKLALPQSRPAKSPTR